MLQQTVLTSTPAQLCSKAVMSLEYDTGFLLHRAHPNDLADMLTASEQLHLLLKGVAHGST